MRTELEELVHRIQSYLERTDDFILDERVRVRHEVYQEVADTFLIEEKAPLPHLKCMGCGGEGLNARFVGHTTPKCVFVQLCQKWGVPVHVSN